MLNKLSLSLSLSSEVSGENRIEFANILRGIAALIVVFSHYCGVFWGQRDVVASFINAFPLAEDIIPTPKYIKMFYTLPFIDWGSYGVALFFIISGFVIPFSCSNKSRLAFFISRFFRIFPTYIVGFSVSILAIFLSSIFWNKPYPYSTYEIFIHYIPGIRDIFWSRNIDGIIWTLEVEIKFYILCIMFKKYIYSVKIFYIPAVLFILSLMFHEDSFIEVYNRNPILYKMLIIFYSSSQYVIFMFIGVVFNFIYRKNIKNIYGYYIIFVIMIMFCIHGQAGPYTQGIKFISSYILAVITFYMCFIFKYSFYSSNILKFLSKISYSLYIIHGIFGYVILRILIEIGTPVLLAILSTLCCVLGVATILNYFIELPSQKIGKKLASHFQYSV